MEKKLILPILAIALIGTSYFVFTTLKRSNTAPINSEKTSTDAEPLNHPVQVDANIDTPPFDTSEFQRILLIKDKSQQSEQIKTFMEQQIQSNPSPVLAAISELKGIEDRKLCYHIALLSWQRFDLNSLSNWLAGQPSNPDLDDALISLIDLQDVNKTLDKATVISFAEKLSDSIRNGNLERILQEWVLEEPEKSISWTLTQPDAQKWIGLAFQSLASHSLETTISILSLLEGAPANHLVAAIQAIIDNYDPNKVTNEILIAIKTLTPYEIKEELLGVMFPLLLLSEYVSLADLDSLIDNLKPGVFKDNLYRDLSYNWAAGKDPQEAASYAESLSGESREIAIEATVSSWLSNDLEATSEWLSGVEGNIDLAANTLGHGSAELGNIQLTDKWLNVIEDENMRRQALVDVVTYWYNNDPATGIYHLVYQKNLSTQEKLNLLHEIYPDENFTNPLDALDDLGRLEQLRSAF